MFSKIQLYGERCSGTNYLENLINLNFDIESTFDEAGDSKHCLILMMCICH